MTTKICTKCKKRRAIDLFARRSKMADGARRKSRCQNCVQESASLYYLEHRAEARERSKMAKREMGIRNRELVFNYLLLHPCVVCGETNPVKLDFDHLHNKEFNISQSSRVSTPRLEKEIAKCQVLCAGCHRVKTAKEQKWKIYDWWITRTGKGPVASQPQVHR